MLVWYAKDLEEKKAKAEKIGEVPYAEALQVELLAVQNLIRKYREIDGKDNTPR
jgi:hypothetical protein